MIMQNSAQISIWCQLFTNMLFFGRKTYFRVHFFIFQMSWYLIDQNVCGQCTRNYFFPSWTRTKMLFYSEVHKLGPRSRIVMKCWPIYYEISILWKMKKFHQKYATCHFGPYCTRKSHTQSKTRQQCRSVQRTQLPVARILSRTHSFQLANNSRQATQRSTTHYTLA